MTHVFLGQFEDKALQLMLVKAITPSNASIFPEYILPNIRYLYKDPDVSVRCVLAQCIAPLADNSLRYLEMGQALKAHGTFKLTVTDDYEDALYEVHRHHVLISPCSSRNSLGILRC